MRAILPLLLTVSAVLLAATLASATPFAPKIVNATSRTLVGSYNSSQLYALSVPGYPAPILVANVSGRTRFELGYSWGRLLAHQNIANIHALLNKAFGEKDVVGQLIFLLFAKLQFDHFAKAGLPAIHLQELAGIKQAMLDLHLNEFQDIAEFAVIFTSFPGSITHDIEYLIIDEFNLTAATTPEQQQLKKKLHQHFNSQPHVKRVRSAHQRRALFAQTVRITLERARSFFKRSCSHWGAWNERTVNGLLFAGRNLDWLSKSGIANNSLITVVHPPPSASGVKPIPHVAIAFAGVFGALAGMSKQGMVVTESGDDNKVESLRGYSWTLRLRGVMEQCATMECIKNFWSNASQNTMGINHGLGVASGGFIETENRFGYSAVFGDDDPREKNFVVNQSENCDKNGNWIVGSGPCRHVGAPMKNAVWRTNHAYDPRWLQTAMFGPVPGGDTFTRYMLIASTLRFYEQAGQRISALQAVNITAVAGDKGPVNREVGYKNLLHCPAAAGGSNILSVAFDTNPARPTAYVAFEIYSADGTHSVAACNNYLAFDVLEYA